MLLAVAVQTAVHLVNAFTFELAPLDANSEQSISAWATSVTIFSAALACLLLTLAGHTPARPLVAASGLLTFFSLDETLAVHERAGSHAVEFLGLSLKWDSVIWPLLYLPLTGAALAALLAVSRRAQPRVSRLVRAGLGWLVLAILAEIVSAPFSTDQNLVHVWEGGLEEGMELAGWGLIATGLLTSFSSGRDGGAAAESLSRP